MYSDHFVIGFLLLYILCDRVSVDVHCSLCDRVSVDVHCSLCDRVSVVVHTL